MATANMVADRMSVLDIMKRDCMPFELQPTLTGERLELRPLRPDDWDALYAAASDPLIWEQHPESDRYEEEVFKVFFEDALRSGGAFVVVDTKTQQIIGSTRFHNYDPEKSEIEIGWTFLARKYWGGRYNREMKQLMLTYAFKFVENVVFFVGENNIRSQKATEKIGAVKSGTAKKVYGNRPASLNVRYSIKKPVTKVHQ
jgi:N-acetyltransferase